MVDLDTALRGETPPLVTPFDGTDVDHDALAAVVDHVRDGGVDALFPLGTAGEFASLTAEEQGAVIETVVDASGDLPVVAGVASTAIEDVVARAEAADDAGADAVVATAPYFHAANSPEGTVAFLEEVATRSPLPLVLYNIPQYVNRSLDPDAVATLARLQNVVGLKDSCGDLTYSLSVARATPDDFFVLQGYDTLLLASLRMGLDGGVNALATAVPEVYATIVDEPDSAAAREASDAIGDLFGIGLEVGFATAVKAALAERDVIDDAAVRPPLQELPDHQRGRVEAAVESALDPVQ